MNLINLANCCYPEDQNRTYKVKYEHTVQNGNIISGTIYVVLGPSQNVDTEVTRYLAQTNTIFRTNYKLIKQL